MELCQTFEEAKCSLGLALPLYTNLKNDFKPCIRFDYVEKTRSEEKRQTNFHIIHFKWKMHDLVQVVVHEEYLIYDFTNMVSSVGGSLGLFIGFSFIGFIQAIVDMLQNQRS